MKKFVLVLILTILSFPVVTFADPSVPAIVYDPFVKLYTPGAGDPTPYDLVAYGDKENWETLQLMIDDDKVLDLIRLGKQDEANGDDKISGSLYDFKFDPSDLTGITNGSWTLKESSESKFRNLFNNDQRLYFSLKAGSYKQNDPKKDDGYLLFAMNENWYANMSQAVLWNTADGFLKTTEGGIDIGLSGKNISHISFWTDAKNNPITSASPTPEPSTMMLMGLGLLGFTRLTRKKR